MSNGRLEGIIRWSTMTPDLAIISRGTEDYFASYMDLTTRIRPTNGDKVTFSPQLVNGRYKARKIEFKPTIQAVPAPPPVRLLKKTRSITNSPKPDLPALAKCPSCLSMVKPRHLRNRKAAFERVCPNCKTALDKTTRGPLSLEWIAAVLVGVVVLVGLPIW